METSVELNMTCCNACWSQCADAMSAAADALMAYKLRTQSSACVFCLSTRLMLSHMHTAGDAIANSEANAFSNWGNALANSEANANSKYGDAIANSQANANSNYGDAIANSEANAFSKYGNAEANSESNAFSNHGDAVANSVANAYGRRL